jgi:hypothetical protein
MDAVTLDALSKTLGPVGLAVVLIVALYVKHYKPIVADKPEPKAPRTPADRAAVKMERLVERVVTAELATRSAQEQIARLDARVTALDQRVADDAADIQRSLGEIEGLLRADSGGPPPRSRRG